MDGRGTGRHEPLPWDRPALTPRRDAPPLPWLPADARRVGPPTRPSAPHRLLRVLAAHRRVTAVTLGILLLALAVPAITLLRADEPVGPRTVSTPFLTYTAPAGWVPKPADMEGADGAPLPAVLAGVVHGPGYSCGGESHQRGYAAAALLPPDAAVKPAVRAENLARWFAAASYADGTPAEVSVAFTRPMQVPGRAGPVDATLTEVTARAGGGDASCAAVEGTVLALAAPVGGGVAVLLLAGDTRGGPAEPAAPDRAALDSMIASARLGAA